MRLDERPDGPLRGLDALEARPLVVTDDPGGAADGREAAVRVVDTQMQPELGPRGEHAVRLVGTLGHEVIDQDADVSVGALEQDNGLAALGSPARH